MTVVVEIRRHAPINEDTGEITDRGWELIETVRDQLEDNYDKILTSPIQRARTTIKALEFDEVEEEPAFSIIPGEKLAPFHNELTQIQQGKDITPVEAYFEHNDMRESLREHARDFLGAVMTHVGMMGDDGHILGISHGEVITPAYALAAEGEFSMETVGEVLGYMEGFEITFSHRRIQKVEQIRLEKDPPEDEE